MIITAKRKLTSSVAILCAIMILIGIFPLNLFTVRKADAAGTQIIYFDTSGNGNWNSWNKEYTNYNMYIYAYKGTANSGIINMTSTNLTAQSSDGVIWKYELDTTKYDTIIFVNSVSSTGGWPGDETKQTVNITLSGYSSYTNPCFKLDGGYSGYKKTVTCYELSGLSLAGKTINFKDMTGNLTGNITATFTTDNGVETSLNLNAGQFTIPNDINGKPYTTVEFKNGNTSLGKYNLFNESSSGATPISYDENTCNTFYYGATEKSDNTKVSYWGAKAQSGTVSAKLYLDSDSFPTDGTAPTIQFNNTSGTFSVDSNENVYSYNISSVQTDDIITVTYNGNKYHFFWSDTSKDMVTISNDIANVSLTYGSSNTIYFDATLSKLSYEGSTTDDATMPMSGDDIYCYLYKGSTNVKHKMTKLDPVTKGSNTWSDVYYYTLSDEDIAAGYTYIIFFSSSNGEWPDSNYKASQTVYLTLPKDTNKTCFYADSSDKYIYTNAKRSGYWDKPFTIRDAESGKKADVVDIKQEAFTKDADTLYVNSTFYDYYTDFELNGSNRDDYGDSTDSSHQYWVNFRQFDQALSEYYEDISAEYPIYTGQFQPTVFGSNSYPFSAIADTLSLYGFSSNYQSFIATNNSHHDEGTGTGKYAFAFQGLVSKDLSSNGTPIASGTSGELPYFNEEFLSGNNSKNTKIGEVYNNVAFPFTKADVFSEGVDYWYFDSAKTTLAMQQDNSTGNYYLKNTGNQDWAKNLLSNGKTTIDGSSDTVSTTYGFFPFNSGTKTAKDNTGSTYNYGFGTKLEFTFRLTKDGTVLDSNGNNVDIKFLFSGDDDVWVYIDGQLVLDVGGDHGQVTGMLDFAKKMAYVSQVKYGGTAETEYSADNSNTPELTSVNYRYGGKDGNESTKYKFYKGDSFNKVISNGDTEEHTLTMYYMERGMWESNMKVAFNFPDENSLEVEKQVDVSEVNDIFQEMFKNQSIFTFNIKNYATHYGTKNASGTGAASKVVFADDFNASGQIAPSSDSNTFEYLNSYSGKTNVAHYKALHSNENQAYTDKRLGIIKSDDGVVLNASEMIYLNFDVYCSSQLANNKMYICLTDSSGKKAYGFLNGKLYGNGATAGSWSTIKVILSKLTSWESDFDKSKIASISFEYDDEVDIYLDNFIFEPSVASGETVGFQTNQASIPDYGSVEAGGLQNAYGAKYTSNKNDLAKATYMVGSDGNFVLQNEEVITFLDQFRRGSYISLTENLTDIQKKLFDTSYTVYENNIAVTNMTAGETVTNGNVTSLKGISGYGVDDDRTEEYVSGNSANTGYTSSQKPDADTIVFRSYSNPDSTTASTKLKVVYTNTVNTGSLTITKAKASGSADLNGEFTFYIEFYNVGGVALEENKQVVGPIELGVNGTYTFTGIPVGTEYTIHEVDDNSDNAVLKKVTTGGDDVLIKQNKVNDMATHSVTGTVNDANTEYAYTFYNTKTATMNLKISKKWFNVDEADREKYIPTANAVKFRLLRRSTDGSDWKSVPNYNSFTLDSDWEKTITKLELFNDDNGQPWQYTIRELDKNGDPIANGDTTTIGNVTYEVKYTTSTSSNITTGLIVNNTRIVQDISMPETGGEGGEPFNFVLFGAIAIALAGGILLLNKKYAFLHIGKSSKEVR